MHKLSDTTHLITCTLLMLSLPMFSALVNAQSTPTEFAELSLQDLFEQHVDEADAEQHQDSAWLFSYNYHTVTYEGYRDGTNNLSNSEVLFDPSGQRTSDNFPILPTVITQQVHLFSLAYALNSKSSIQLSVPYIEQSTDHISIVDDYANFTIDSAGLGDVKLSTSYEIYNQNQHFLRLSAGISIPTGSIDEKGDTPRGPGDQQLPYTMQLGSGTYDIPLGINYNSSKHNWSASFSATIRTGENDRDYRLGNHWSLSTRYDFNFSKLGFQPFTIVDYQYAEQIRGLDREILEPNSPFPFAASIINPALFGGSKANLKLGLKLPFGDKHQQRNIVFTLGLPIYQDLNGPQPKTSWTGGFKLQAGF